MRKLLTLFAAVAWMATFGASWTGAQQGADQSQPPAQSPDQDQQKAADPGASKAQEPIPAYRSPLAGAAGDEEDETTEIMPDDNALTGVRALGLGLTREQSYWQSHAQIFESADSNPGESTGHNSWGSWTSVSGGVDVHKTSQNNQLDVSYLGGGTFSSDSGSNSAAGANTGNGAVQELSFSEKVLFHRWAFSLIDALGYLPESASGFGGLGTSLPGGGLPGGGTFGPGQSLLVGRGQNLTNQLDAEADVFVTRRTSLTFVGGYANLNYFDSDLLNYGTAVARVGYNYQLSRKNTIGLDYTFSDTDYSNFHQSIVNHTFQAVYGRRVTGQLAFQLGAGPQIAMFQVPITPAAGAGEGDIQSATSVLWSLSASLKYARKRTSYSLSYDHGVSGGGGVLAGSEGDTVAGSITRQMTRQFSSGVTGGYSRTRGLAVLNTTAPGSSQTYDYWYGGVNLTYPLGRTVALSVTYQVQYQNSGTAFCIGTQCSTDVLRNMISVGLDWRDRQRRF